MTPSSGVSQIPDGVPPQWPLGSLTSWTSVATSGVTQVLPLVHPQHCFLANLSSSQTRAGHYSPSQTSRTEMLAWRFQWPAAHLGQKSTVLSMGTTGPSWWPHLTSLWTCSLSLPLHPSPRAPSTLTFSPGPRYLLTFDSIHCRVSASTVGSLSGLRGLTERQTIKVGQRSAQLLAWRHFPVHGKGRENPSSTWQPWRVVESGATSFCKQYTGEKGTGHSKSSRVPHKVLAGSMTAY